MKRLKASEEGEGHEESSQRSYRTQRRGGKGLRDIKTTQRNGPVVGIVSVSDQDELLMMTARGKIQRIAASDVSIIGRNTQGVKIMSLDEDDTLVAVKRVPMEEENGKEERGVRMVGWTARSQRTGHVWRWSVLVAICFRISIAPIAVACSTQSPKRRPMITRLYADNFRTLVNFELQFGPMNLLLGPNGSGKSNFLKVIWRNKGFRLHRKKLDRASFPIRSLCRWDTRKTQTFEIDLRSKEGTYTYRLEVEHDVEHKRCRVNGERLTHNQKPIYVSGTNGARLYKDGVAGTKFMSTRPVPALAPFTTTQIRCSQSSTGG